MSSFIFWTTVLLGVEMVCKIVCLSLNMIPERTRGGLMLDALFGFGWIVWGVYLLARAA